MDTVAPFAAAGAASLAAVLDVRFRRIPNWLTGSVCAAGLVLNAWYAGPNGLLLALAGGALGLAILLPFHALHAIGAGDVKLLAALGMLIGPHALVSVAVYGGIVGGLISVVILLTRGRLLLMLNEVFVLHRPPTRSGATAPYGVAIASGMYLSLVLPGILG
ncbi:MAG TPA: prepilin peptidase [Chloroflexota bacterium]|jgi:prepilin peptidase CpaA